MCRWEQSVYQVEIPNTGLSLCEPDFFFLKRSTISRFTLELDTSQCPGLSLKRQQWYICQGVIPSAHSAFTLLSGRLWAASKSKYLSHCSGREQLKSYYMAFGKIEVKPDFFFLFFFWSTEWNGLEIEAYWKEKGRFLKMKDLTVFEKVFKCSNLLTAYNDMQIWKDLVFRSLNMAEHMKGWFMLFFLTLETEARALCMLSQCSATEFHPLLNSQLTL